MSTVRAITNWFLLQNKVTTKSGTLWASWIKHKLISPPKPRLWNHNLLRFNFATKTCSLHRELLSPSRELLNSAGAVPGDLGLSVLREEAGQCCHGFHARNSRFKNELEGELRGLLNWGVTRKMCLLLQARGEQFDSSDWHKAVLEGFKNDAVLWYSGPAVLVLQRRLETHLQILALIFKTNHRSFGLCLSADLILTPFCGKDT
ncbi:uncharacterized protein LOC128913491 isoform X2 [Rissa tridactyla]|uniref:uncharacterized protein LOC128913491 isoform X2 n=1 Tax=Rissa tridactyla TaxID=75485 RepID=UPI0023BA63B6|nr:uncharacterized protein LOC128913491 isoform X2 [Rissa tridactyla]